MTMVKTNLLFEFECYNFWCFVGKIKWDWRHYLTCDR